MDPPGRDPIVGPPGGLLGALLCGGAGGGVVGLGAGGGCGLPLLGADVGLVVGFGVEGIESLIDPACRPDPCAEDPAAGGTAEDWESGDPPGKTPPLTTVVDEESLAPSGCPPGPPPELPHPAKKTAIAQARAAANAVAAALACAAVPPLGMDATVAKSAGMREGLVSVHAVCGATAPPYPAGTAFRLITGENQGFFTRKWIPVDLFPGP